MNRRKELQKYLNIDTNNISEEGIIALYEMACMIDDEDIPSKFRNTISYLFSLIKTNNVEWQRLFAALTNGAQYNRETRHGAVPDVEIDYDEWNEEHEAKQQKWIQEALNAPKHQDDD